MGEIDIFPGLDTLLNCNIYGLCRRGYEDGIAYDPHQSYDNYSYASHGGHGHGPHGPPTSILGGVGNISGVGSGVGGRGGHYDNADYESDYSRRDYYQNSPGYAGTSNLRTPDKIILT